MAVTAGCVGRDFLTPGLEAQAVNDWQQQLIANATPECDSIVEYGDLLLSSVEPEVRPLVEALLELVGKVAELNAVEREEERRLTGAADRLVHDLRQAELNGTRGLGRGQVGYRPALKALSGPLGVLVDAGANRKVGDAVRAVDRALLDYPTALLLSGSVTRGLRQRKTAMLLELMPPLEATA